MVVANTYLIYNKNLIKYYLSSSCKGIEKSKINLKKKISAILKVGSLYKPWDNYKFDLIINDVSGVSSEKLRYQVGLKMLHLIKLNQNK